MTSYLWNKTHECSKDHSSSQRCLEATFEQHNTETFPASEKDIIEYNLEPLNKDLDYNYKWYALLTTPEREREEFGEERERVTPCVTEGIYIIAGSVVVQY